MEELVIQVVEARNVLAEDMGGTSDPYAVVTLADSKGKDISAAGKQKTQIHKKTLNPVWKQTFRFGQSFDIRNSQCISVKLYDYDYVGRDCPLGMVQIALESIKNTTKDQPINDWFPLQKFDDMKAIRGEVRLIIYKFNPNEPLSGGVTISGATVPEESKIEGENAPNLLNLTVISARGLRAMDRNNTSDPLVIIKCGSFTSKTSTKTKTLTPVWNQKFKIPCTNPSLVLKLVMEDYDLTVNDFMGQVEIPLSVHLNGKETTSYYELLNKSGQREQLPRGELQLKIHWVYDPKVAERMKAEGEGFFSSAFYKIGEKLRGEGDDDDDDDDPASDDEGIEGGDTEKTEEQRKKEREEKEKAEQELKKELENIEIKSGDYTIQVHIIEARDLKPKDATGTSDPVVYVEVLGQQQSTEVRPSCTNAVWDDLLIFTFRNVDKEEVEMGAIKISVQDANTVMRNELIGSSQFDTMFVYSQKNHEIYRKWLALVNTEAKDNSGIQGYLKASMTILGPGDKLPVHDLDKEIQIEQKGEKGAGDISKMVLIPPSIEQQVQYLVTTIYHCEALPAMDFNAIGKDGIDAYVSVKVAGNPELRTKVKTKKGRRDQLNPSFNEELWSPYRVPSLTKNISIGVWDYDRIGKNEVVAHIHQNLKLVESLGSMSPFWANLYGAPIKGNLESDIKEHMNNFPETGTLYRGRVLMSMRIEKDPERKEEEINHKKKARKIKPREIPPTRMYQFRAMAITGSSMPKFMSLAHPGKSSKLQIVMTCGLTEIETQRAANENGMCYWNEYIQSDPTAYPEDPSQIPDIFVYICKGAGKDRKIISYRRFSAKDLLDERFSKPASWLYFKEDEALNALTDTEFPGIVLIRLGFGTVEDANATADDWSADVSLINKRVPYQVRVNLYQARSLPAADSNGLIDPYIKIKFMGQERKSQIKKLTKDPLWYETHCFDVELPSLDYAPQVTLELWDWDFSPLDPDDFVGITFINLRDAFTLSKEAKQLPDPSWYEFFLQEPGDSEGEVLASIQLIRKQNPDEVMPPVISIKPETRKAYLEVIVLGLRDLIPYNFIPIQLPFVEMHLGSKEHSHHEICTDRSKRPTGTNPNFLQRIVREVDLPLNALFTPRLNITVKDVRLGGFSTPVIGNASVDMMQKVPWSANYTPPQQAAIADIKLKDGAPGDFESKEEETRPSAKNTLEAKLKELPEEDTGAGVFGALKLMQAESLVENIVPEDDVTLDVDSEKDDNLDDENDTPKYRINREETPAELEAVLETTPFENYPIFLGQKFGGIGKYEKKSKGTIRQTGVFKGLIRIMLNENDPPLFDIQQLLSPQPYQIRIYVLRGISFKPMDVGIGGRPGKSDPYIKISLGKQKIDDVKNYIEDVTDPDFYKLFELNCELPGASRLSIASFDYDAVGSDDLIGQTVIDLEDRLFDNRWQSLGEQYETDMRYRPRPIEKRGLYVPTSNVPQGTLEMWLDIMTPSEADGYPAIDISLPPPVEFELRVVIWKTRDVVSMDTFTDMNDLYARCWLVNSEPQETDIHWRCKKGKGSFNWRMKFPVRLGHNQMNTKFPYFHVQLWDKDIFSYNDAIAEGMLDLAQHFRKAYKAKTNLNFFEKKKKDSNDKNQEKIDPKEQEKINKTSEADEAVRQLKELTGLWDMDPADSAWLKLERTNFETHVREPMGEVSLSMELVPLDKAQQQPVGYGRSDPNNSPYLPPPNGRLKMSMNPFYVFNELLGPKVCCRVMCCCACILLMVLMYFASPFINILILSLKN